MDRKRLQEAIGYQFRRPELLTRALTHRSYGSPHNERLEFLGDAILNCVIAAELFHRFPSLREGDLSRLRANLVREPTLHQVAQGLKLGDELRLGEGELKSGGHARPSILADGVEAIFGAVFLDGGFDAAEQTVLQLYRPLVETIDPRASAKDAKTRLQELLQGRKQPLPQYNVISTQGAAHSQTFEVECLIPELDVRTTGSGASRRLAEQEAAQSAYDLIRSAVP
jgi:ribonuclease-3